MDRTIVKAAMEQLGGAGSLAEVQEIVRHAARRSVGADGATFVLRDGDQCFYLDEDAMSPLWKGQRFPLTQCISGWAMLNDDVARIPDITVDERIPQEAYRPTFVKSLVMVPVGNDEPVAAIGAYWASQHAATEEELEALRDLAQAAADALDRVGTAGAPLTPSGLGSGY